MEVWTTDLKNISNDPRRAPVIGPISELLVQRLCTEAEQEAARRGMGELALDTMDVEVRPDVSKDGVLGITCHARYTSALLYYNLDAGAITEPQGVVAQVQALLGAAAEYTGEYSDGLNLNEADEFGGSSSPYPPGGTQA